MPCQADEGALLARVVLNHTMLLWRAENRSKTILSDDHSPHRIAHQNRRRCGIDRAQTPACNDQAGWETNTVTRSEGKGEPHPGARADSAADTPDGPEPDGVAQAQRRTVARTRRSNTSARPTRTSVPAIGATAAAPVTPR